MNFIKRLLSTIETMEYLNIGKTTLFKLVKEGKLKPVKIDSNLRFDIEDLNEFIEKSKEVN
jgi:excisionase family DNA binding protein